MLLGEGVSTCVRVTALLRHPLPKGVGAQQESGGHSMWSHGDQEQGLSLAPMGGDEKAPWASSPKLVSNPTKQVL